MSTASPAPIEWDAIPEAMRTEMNISKEDFEMITKNLAEREKHTPAVGTTAPDFELRRLSAEGVLTDETLRLADLRGRPVALVFGSYT